MAFDAVLGTQQFTEKQVAAGGHGPFGIAWPVKADQGVLEAGTVVAVDENNKLVPYGETSKEIGTGDGSNKDFSGSLDAKPLQPGTVVVTDGTQTLCDDGCGRLYGDGSGTVNYETAKVNASFTAAPDNGATVSASAKRRLFGVLANKVDTTKETVAVVYRHGTVNKAALLVDGAAIDDADVARLVEIGIYSI
ncbi:MAG TPA: hypothetical protein ENF32_02615 [Thermosulfidibacter takaii]|uniref:Head decoration protein n=1 Tax=Thermosulfidibacter takaii TaxID=412593 RepID=A0A7C0U634_9BACT|nr:hypothetical protein [Thermosulfidibacter takaii]